jgi:hypothetical protein
MRSLVSPMLRGWHVSIAGPQNRCHQLARFAIKDQERMVHVLLVVAMLATAFLLAVGGLVRRVEVKQYLLRSSTFLASYSLAGMYRSPIASAIR